MPPNCSSSEHQLELAPWEDGKAVLALLSIIAAYAPGSMKASWPASDLKVLTMHPKSKTLELRIYSGVIRDKSWLDVLCGPLCTPVVLALLASGTLTMLLTFSSLHNFACVCLSHVFLCLQEFRDIDSFSWNFFPGIFFSHLSPCSRLGGWFPNINSTCSSIT